MEYVTKLDTGGYMMQKTYLDKIPILVPTHEQENEINEVVDHILKFQKSNKKTEELERKIEILLYKYYQLDFEQVKTIDKDFWLTAEEYDKLKDL